MSKSSFEDCKTADDFARALDRSNAEYVGQTGSHRKWKGPNGGIVVVPMHKGDLPKGTRRSILKMIAAAGIALAIALALIALAF
jgi:predicted RNA binding protein YcfA (HicA-like mRNA interferase family)